MVTVLHCRKAMLLTAYPLASNLRKTSQLKLITSHPLLTFPPRPNTRKRNLLLTLKLPRRAVNTLATATQSLKSRSKKRLDSRSSDPVSLLYHSRLPPLLA